LVVVSPGGLPELEAEAAGWLCPVRLRCCWSVLSWKMRWAGLVPIFAPGPLINQALSGPHTTKLVALLTTPLHDPW